MRSPKDVFYRDELGDETTVTYTRRTPEGWMGTAGRIDAGLVERLAWPDGMAFVCGLNGFVEAGARLLMEAGYGLERIWTERFVPSG